MNYMIRGGTTTKSEGPVRVQFVVDPSRKGHVSAMLESIKKFWDLEDETIRENTPVIIKGYLLDARCRARVGLAPVAHKALPGQTALPGGAAVPSVWGVIG